MALLIDPAYWYEKHERRLNAPSPKAQEAAHRLSQLRQRLRRIECDEARREELCGSCRRFPLTDHVRPNGQPYRVCDKCLEQLQAMRSNYRGRSE